MIHQVELPLCETVPPPGTMTVRNLHRRCSFPSYSFSSRFNPRFLEPNLCISPKQPQKLASISISILRTSLKNDRKNFNHSLSAAQDPHRVTEDRVEEAREAVREYLQEVGASSEDAYNISLNCPNYLNMLIDGVDDLDHWNSLASTSSSQDVTGDVFDFKKKVYRMAEQKGDNGLLPFLESLGLSLSSATHLARYLSSSQFNAFPLLIHKVNYLKETLYSDSDNYEVIGKNARRMMAHLSVSTDEDVQQTLAFFEKIEARRGGLNLLGSERTSFCCLIESFPRLLFLPLDTRVKPMVKFLGDIGVPEGYIRNVILLFPPILSYDIDKDIRPRLQLFQKIGAKDNDFGKMLVKYPWILSAGILENFEKVLNFLDEEKVPKIYASSAIKNWPHILGSSISKLKLMVEQFNDMGIGNQKLGQVLAASPQLLLRKPQEFLQMVSFFKDLGLDEEAIAKTFVRCPEIFAANIEITLKKKLQFLSKVGISKSHLPRVIRKYPEVFVCDVDRALMPRMRYLMKIGLSKKDVGSMLRRFSPLLGYSVEEVLSPKIEFLVKTMEKPVSDVVEYPRYFSYSLEKKIKPRYWVLKARNIEFTLKEMLGKNDEEFAAEYLEVVDGLVVPPPPS